MILKAAPSIRNTYLFGKYIVCSLKALTLYLGTYRSHRKMTKEIGRSQGWAGYGGVDKVGLFSKVS